MPNLSYGRVVELSHPIHPGIPRWPGDPPIAFTQVADRGQDGYFLRTFSMGEHAATHLNAPLSFFDNGAGVDAIPSEDLIRPAVVIDVRKEAAANPDFALGVERVQTWEAPARAHSGGLPGAVVLGVGSFLGQPRVLLRIGFGRTGPLSGFWDRGCPLLASRAPGLRAGLRYARD